jgi:epoxyqueuosine reductase QueG
MPGKWTEMDLKDWTSMSKEAFDRVFDQHPLKRTGYDGLMRNLKVNGFKA